MIEGARTALTLLAIASSSVAIAQQGSIPSPQIPVSGRIVFADNVTVQHLKVTFRKLPEIRLKDQPASTDASGRFEGMFDQGAAYEIFVNLSDQLALEIGTFQVDQGNRVDLGDILLRSPSSGKFTVALAGAVHIEAISKDWQTNQSSGFPNGLSIAAIYVPCAPIPNEFCRDSRIHVGLSDGSEVQPPPEKDQVGISQASISKDRTAAAWLVDYDNCCTSYPLSLRLVAYRVGKPLLRLEGRGIGAMFGWSFLNGGSQVAFWQSLPHGDDAPHFELHDVQSGRLLAQWDSPPDDDTDNKSSSDKKEPAWVKALHSLP